MKILVFTEKPFAEAAVKAIANVINASRQRDGTRREGHVRIFWRQ